MRHYTTDPRTHRADARRSGACASEALEARRLLSADPLDPTFVARERAVPFAAYAHDVAVRDDGKVLVAETRLLGDAWRMAVSRYNADGSLDATFGAAGRAYPNFGGGPESAAAMAVDADGRIVLAGGSGGDYAVARLNPDGTPDFSFGGDGKVTVDLGGTDERLRDVHVDAAGRIVAAGNDGVGAVNLFRLTAGGAPDPSFGGGDGVAQTTLTLPGFRQVGGIVTLPDNRIVLAAATNTFFLRVQRFAVDGSLETTFATPAGAGVPYDVALQPDGKVIVGGLGSQFSLLRYLPSGALDTTFGTSGVVTTKVGAGAENVAALAVQPDGRIVATGVAWREDTHGYDFFTARYLPGGALDASFGTAAIARTDVLFQSTDFPGAVAIGPGGKVVVAGDVHDLYADVYTTGVVRYNGDGALDTSFGGTGKVVSAFDVGHVRTIEAVARQPDGKVVVAGTQQVGLEFDFFVARCLPDGSRDSGFGDDGVTVTDFGGYDAVAALLIQPDGRIVLGGRSSAPGAVPRFALARYTAGGRLDPTFDGDGRVLTAMPAPYSEGVEDLDLYGGNRIVATGYGGAARYNADGSLDRTFAGDGTLNRPDAWFLAGAVQGGRILFADPAGVDRVNADGSDDPTFRFVRLPPPAHPDTEEDEEPDTIVADMEVDAAGRIVLGGTYHANDYSDVLTAFAVQRYLPDGAPDASFGDGGQTVVDFPEIDQEEMTEMALAPDGAPVLVGWGRVSIGDRYGYAPVVARYTTDGRLDSGFGLDGRAVAEDYTSAHAATVQPDGKVLVAVFRDGAGYPGRTPSGAAVIRFGAPSTRPTASFDRADRTVYVTGTNAADTLRLDSAGGRLTVWLNGRRQTFSNRWFDRVRVYAGEGADSVTVTGRVEGLEVFGGGGDDRLRGGSGDEAFHGGRGNDTLDGGLGADVLAGGEGTDAVDYAARTASLVVSIDDSANDGEANENDDVRGDVEDILGGSGNDTLTGSSANNRLYGAGGNDTLTGGGGKDQLRGQAGNDTLYAKNDNAVDFLDGGSGTDKAQKDTDDFAQYIEQLLV